MLSYPRALKKWNQDGADLGWKVRLGNVWALPRRGTPERAMLDIVRQGEEMPRPRPEGAPIPEAVRRNNERPLTKGFGQVVAEMRQEKGLPPAPQKKKVAKPVLAVAPEARDWEKVINRRYKSSGGTESYVEVMRRLGKEAPLRVKYEALNEHLERIIRRAKSRGSDPKQYARNITPGHQYDDLVNAIDRLEKKRTKPGSPKDNEKRKQLEPLQARYDEMIEKAKDALKGLDEMYDELNEIGQEIAKMRSSKGRVASNQHLHGLIERTNDAAKALKHNVPVFALP